MLEGYSSLVEDIEDFVDLLFYLSVCMFALVCMISLKYLAGILTLISFRGHLEVVESSYFGN